MDLGSLGSSETKGRISGNLNEPGLTCHLQQGNEMTKVEFVRRSAQVGVSRM